ncbi:hypothetical protein OH76DRAFT_1424369, partial [Lentinus brumalis]
MTIIDSAQSGRGARVSKETLNVASFNSAYDSPEAVAQAGTSPWLGLRRPRGPILVAYMLPASIDAVNQLVLNGLVPLVRIDDAGYATTFAGGECVIVDAEGKTMGRVPKTRGLYVVMHERDAPQANAASDKVEELTEMQAHPSLWPHQ